MKVAMVHLGFPPEDIAGGSIYVYHLANELSRLGHKIDVFTYKPKKTFESSDYPIEKNVRVKRLNYIYLPIFMEKFLPGLNKRITKEYDLLHGFQSLYLTTTLAFKKAKSIDLPFVCTTFDLGVFSSELTKSLRFKTQIESTFKHMAFGTLISENTEKILKGMYPKYAKKNKVIPPGIDPNIFNPKKVNEKQIRKKYKIKKEKKNLLFVGRISREKGIEVLVEALPLIQKKISNIKLNIVGEGKKEYKNKIKRMIEEKNLNEKVSFFGKVPLKDLAGLYETNNLLVLPSTTAAEGFGMVVLEALAMGTPVVTTEIVGSSYILKKNPSYGKVVKEKSPIELGKGIIEALRKKRKINTKEISKKYSWKAIAKEFQKVYVWRA